jgi:hypothetical protein
MSAAALQTLSEAATGLRRAMESSDADRIRVALERFIPALEAVQAVGAWHATDETRTLLKDLRARLDSDQQLARLLGDLTQQQLDRVAIAAPDKARHVYGRRP